MSGPDTRDPDMVKMPRDQFEFMMETTRTLVRIEQKIDSNQKTLSDHIEEDKEALVRIHQRLDNQGTVVSGINNEKQRLIGGKTAAVGIFGGIATIIGLIIAWFHK